jgi:hypothetical protein
MPEYYDYCGKWVWPSGEPEDWEETWEPPREQQPKTSHLMVDVGPYIVE